MVRHTLLAMGFSLLASTAAAQERASDSTVAVPAESSVTTIALPLGQVESPRAARREAAGPTISATAVAYRPADAEAAALPQRRATRSERQAVTLMIIGGGMLLGGLIIGDDAGTVIAVGGLVVGLIGLYNYVQ